MVHTPYGTIPASHVHQIDGNTIVKLEGDHLQLVDIASGKVIKDLGAISAEDIATTRTSANAYIDSYAYAKILAQKAGVPDLSSASVSTAANITSRSSPTQTNRVAAGPLAPASNPSYYMGAAQNDIKSFSTTWLVPNNPIDYPQNGNQSKFFAIWNGLAGGALQPVLQWDNGQGPNYTILNEYFAYGHYFLGPTVKVTAGTKLIGRITYLSNTSTTWTYKLSFDGYPAADLTVVRETEATGLAQCFEAYSQLMSLWPNQALVAMKNINLTLRSGTPPATIDWKYGGGSAPVTPSGNNSVVVSNSSSNGEIDFYMGDGTVLHLTQLINWSLP